MKMPLVLGQLGDDNWQVRRSGLQWLCPDGHLCRPGEAIASCYVGVTPRSGVQAGPFPFVNEYRDLKVVLATPYGGVLRQAPGLSRGGFLDLQPFHLDWRVGAPVGSLEGTFSPTGTQSATGLPLRMLLLTGRRWLEPAIARGPLLTGWHDRGRAWWWNEYERGERFGHVLAIGICELLSIMRGDQLAFLELFDLLPGPIHVSHVPDDILVPAAAVLNGQLRRTASERAALAADLVASFNTHLAAEGASALPAVADWLVVGHLLQALLRCSFLEDAPVLTHRGVHTVGPPGAVILSLHSDGDLRYLRHRKLGYAIKFHGWRLDDFGPVLRRWLQTEFELVRQSLEALQREYLELIDRIQAQTGAHVLVLNVVSSVPTDQTFCYAGFDRPLGATLASIRDKELNLLLHVIARARDISIVDVAALAADLGLQPHFATLVHADRVFEAAVREQIVHILRERGVAGC